MYRGDIRLGDTIHAKFTTRRFSTGAPFTLAGTPAISAYVGSSGTQITAGITLTADFDSVTGFNLVTVVASSANGYTAASDVDLVITTGTVDSVSVVGEVVASFSIENRSALMPTTAARKLVVDAAGLADANVVKVGPTGSGTAQTAGDIIGDTNDIQSRLPAALGANGNLKADVRDWIGTAVSTPTVAGVPNVNTKTWNDLTTVALPLAPTNAGRTLDVNATGEAKADISRLLGDVYQPVTNSGVPDVNVTKWNNLTTVALPLTPTTAGRTLDVTATGAAGIDWGNLENPTSVNSLTNTDVNNVLGTLTATERTAIATALLNYTNGIETSVTPKQALQLIAAALAGELSGAATTTVTIKAANNNGTTRITATVDADGNRSALTLNI